MTPTPTPGQLAYAAYCQRFVAYQHHTSGTVMPEPWEHLPLLVQMCWEEAADAVRAPTHLARIGACARDALARTPALPIPVLSLAPEAYALYLALSAALGALTTIAAWAAEDEPHADSA